MNRIEPEPEPELKSTVSHGVVTLTDIKTTNTPNENIYYEIPILCSPYVFSCAINNPIHIIVDNEYYFVINNEILMES